jgi:tyrosyl-tRNA synthetase
MYGKTMSIPDESLSSWYELLLGSEPPAEEGPRDAKRALARELVTRFHGPDAASAAETAFDRQFVRHELPEDVPELQWRGAEGTVGAERTERSERTERDEETPRAERTVHIPALLAQAFGLSTSDARRAISQGGVKLDGQPLADGSFDLAADELDGKVVQLGKRRFVRVRVR